MSKKVLIISTSPRKNGNSETLADAFLKGVADGGNTAEKISLYDKTIGFCKGCLACQKTKRCVIHDDADMIAQKMLTADVLVFATPIYYYEMSGQMKTMLDRANPLFSSDYAFRDIYFLSTAAEDEEGVDARAINGLEGWIECFPKANLAGTVFAGGVAGAGEICGHSALTKAYEMGKLV
ncbi:MAG: flavodoxin family protein [Firmicutes bacterium]|nr:flavodoxin family protein [Bacillota bacterium]